MQRKTTLLALSALMLLSTATPSMAQNSPATCDGYWVQSPDNIWHMADSRGYNPAKYRAHVQKSNPQVNWADPKITFPDKRFSAKSGREIVIITEHQCLHGLSKTGNVVEAAAPQPILGTSGSAPAAPYDWSWLLWLGGIALLAATAYGASQWNKNRRQLARDPVTAGPAFVPGGVSEENAPAHMQEVGARQYQRETGQQIEPARIRLVSQTFLGYGNGVARVAFKDGTTGDFRAENHEVYRAEIEYPDGTRRTVRSLRGCGNDVLGPVDHYTFEPGFTITRERVVAETPVAEPAAPAADLAPATAVVEEAQAPIAAAPVAETRRPEPQLDAGEVHFFFQPSADPNVPHALEIKGADHTRHATVKVHPTRGISARFFTPGQVAQPAE